MAVLEINSLTKTYGKGDTSVTALDHVSFSMNKGEFVAIIGASGSGKSTLMNLIGGIDHSTSGSVKIDGNEIYNLIPTLTTAENIMLPRLLDHRKPDPDKLSSILETIGLSERATHLPSELSGGQQQRVSVGRALINDPAFILADEPTGNLDSKASREIIDLLRLANKRSNQTLLVITHDEKIALQADRIITLGDGQILSDEVMKA
ncbi:ABC transporter ATP-binding protein [Acetobacterium tundrae]|uniref:ATP-binding cassette domain-containing protein n=1 Tax=Acetobacterium tundrae TaxID=132932 RepID=A0ABR6WIS4_9FIRM|nr:ABC transporter ATP-binding protein [Acetobacterium tundrae]MBC3796394.1 ATP-binding cassette domain-containing protein [Acetobacterium tundrae]